MLRPGQALRPPLPLIGRRCSALYSCPHTERVEVLRLTGDGVERWDPDDLDALAVDDGIVWVDVPAWEDQAAAALTDRFGIHPRAAADCARRNPVPKVHVYPDHVFVVLHAPERGA